MKRLAVILSILLLLLVAPRVGDTQSVGGRLVAAKPVRVGSSLPATCAVGELFFLNSGAIALYQCNPANTWTGAGTGGVGTFTTLTGTNIFATAPDITPGADGTLVNAGEARRVVYKITVTGVTCVNASGFIAASTNADCVIATFPAKTEITRIIVDNTIGFTCSATCTGTKTVQVGKSAGGTEYVVASNAAVIATYGLVNGDLGASLTTSATTPVGGGDLPSFSATTTIKARYVSGTGNWGTGAATTVNAGSTTFYIETLVFP